MQQFVSKNGQRYGPYSLDELRQEVFRNVFRPEDFASADQGKSWIQIKTVPGMGSLDFTVEARPDRHLLVIRYRGHVRSSAVERCAREVALALMDLKPGFRLLADFTDLRMMDLDCAHPLQEIMRLCNGREVSMVVRIMPRPEQDIGLRIMSFFHYGPAVRIETYGTCAEAEKLLSTHASAGPGDEATCLTQDKR